MITHSKINKKVFNGIWQQIKNTKEDVTLERVVNIAKDKKIDITEIKEVQFGFNSKSPAIMLSTAKSSALFPMVKPEDMRLYRENKEAVDTTMRFWCELDWFIPPYIMNFELISALSYAGIDYFKIDCEPRVLFQKRLDNALPIIYTLGLMVVINEQVLTKAFSIQRHVPIIREAILAFYSGMKVAAIAALIPIIENILGELINNQSMDIKSKVDKSLDAAMGNVKKLFFSRADWIPTEYEGENFLIVLDERYRMLKTLKEWLLNSFYCNTGKYENHSGFNRHSFAHAKSNLWQNEANFFRAIGLIQALAFVEVFSDIDSNISIFIPKSNEESKAFHCEVLACLDTQLVKKLYIQKYQLDNKLPHKLTASDDGWLLRASMLSKKMNEEVIKRLRDAGWQCEAFSDPVKDGEYITVRAKKSGQSLKIALLYSCATGNDIYKILDKTCEYILYCGAYYKQDSYAYEVNAKVMPVNAWVIPSEGQDSESIELV